MKTMGPKGLLVLALILGAGQLAAADPPKDKPEQTAAPATGGAPPASPASPQPAINQQEAAIAGMQVGIQAQRLSVLQQVGATQPPAGFFTVPWTSAPAMAPTPACDQLPAGQVDRLIGEAATREGLQPTLLRAVINQESGFRPCAVSPKGALGLMQLMPGTAEELGVQNPFDPKENVDSGARFLKQLLNRYGGDVTRALAAYNAGPTRVDNAGGVPAIAETRRYVSQILSGLP